MKRFLMTSALIVLFMGCARVSVQGSKEPIKLDISMRLDIYQHVQKDIDEIENLVIGSKDSSEPKDQRGSLGFHVAKAYAQEALGPEVEQAASRRKSRISKLYALESKGMIGENSKGLVEARGAADAAARQLADEENADRMAIYKAVAAKNNISLQEVQKLYAKRLSVDAPAGTPVETVDAQGAAGQWKTKE